MTLRSDTTALVLGIALLSGAGCARAPQLVKDPVDIGPAVTAVPLEPPFPALGPTCELRFEFDRPGDSHRAAAIHVAFVTSMGQRDTLTDVRLDRRGESVVSQLGRLAVEGATPARPRLYRALELRSDTPLRVRGIRAVSGP